MILRDPKATDGGAATVTPPAASPTPTFTPPKSAPGSKGFTPQMPKEPPKEVLEKEFKIEPGLLSEDGDPTRVSLETVDGAVKDAKKVDDKAPSTEVKAPEKKVEKVEAKKEEKKEELPKFMKPPKTEAEKKEEKKGEKKEEIKQVVPPEKKERDYTGFSNEEAEMLKQMSNPAFEYTSKLIREHKESQKNKTDIIYQHPDGYLLTPEFSELQTTINFAQREGDYWRDCLGKIKKGEAVKALLRWDDKGNPVFGEDVPASDQLEEVVRSNMQIAYGAVQQSQGKLQQQAQTFKQRLGNDLQSIQAERVRRFAWAADPKYLDYTINMGESGDVAIKDIRQNIINLFPPYFRNNPATEVAADLFVALRLQAAELEEAKNGKQLAEVKQAEAQRGEPSSELRTAPQGEPVGGVREFSLAGLPKEEIWIFWID